MRQLTVLVLIGATALLFSCGKVSEKVAEGVAEKAIEKSGGGEADVDISEEGIAISAEDEDGSYSITGGAKAKLPEGFPSDVLVYDGAVIEMAMDNPGGFTVALRSDDPITDVVEKYKQQLTADGWQKQSVVDTGEAHLLVYGKGDRVVQVTVADDEGVTRIGLTASKEQSNG